jgi:hypothetical protein
MTLSEVTDRRLQAGLASGQDRRPEAGGLMWAAERRSPHERSHVEAPYWSAEKTVMQCNNLDCNLDYVFYVWDR